RDPAPMRILDAVAPPLGLTGTTRPPYAARCSWRARRRRSPRCCAERRRREVADGALRVHRCSTGREEDKMADPIELLIQGRAHELGPGFAVRRVLPSVKRRMVGPFIFLDHFGPMTIPPGGVGMEVRPHPHIGLATVTYLFEGGIFHRDSLGYAQAILPGDVNWMTAGSGIAHSERTEEEMKRTGFTMHGVQTWVALPHTHEETAPSFQHVAKADLPAWSEGGTALRLI